MHYQQLIDWIDDRIATSPGWVVVFFLVLTVVFVIGLGNVEQETGTSQFTEDLQSQQALEDINREFGGSFGGDPTTTTTLLQRSANVLSKPALVRTLRVQKRLATHDGLRVTSIDSAASVVATELDPDATTAAQKLRAVEQATPGEIDAAVKDAAADDALGSTLSDDFNAESATASATELTAVHGADEITDRQRRVESIVDTVAVDMQLQGDWPSAINASLLLTLPAALLLIVVFLIVAYRDPIDLLLGIVALLMTLVWTFGFLGIAGIPFNLIMVSVPPLLIAVGVDFGIHAVNRYREERVEGRDIVPSMRTTTDQLLVAFFIVAGTTVIGFLANLTSALGPIRDIGLVAAIGIVFTLGIFGVFLPAAKVLVDRRREGSIVPTFTRKPLGSSGSALGRFLRVGAVIADRAAGPFLVVMLVASAGVGVYATGVDTTFEVDDQLPPAKTADSLQSLPEPFAPPESYPYVAYRNYKERHFSDSGAVLLYVRGQLDSDHALEAIHDAGRDPPSTYVRDGRHAESRSIVTVIQSHADQNPEFERLVDRNDANDNGIPDDNLDAVYDALLSSSARDRALQYLNPDRRTAKVVYTVEEDAAKATVTSQTRTLAANYPYEASATGSKLIYSDLVDLLMGTVVQSLLLALGGATVFLVFAYWLFDGRPSLGIANMLPIAMTVAALVATMRYLGVSFNIINGMLVSLTIGLGIDYTVHFTHRFVDELETESVERALVRSAQNTGGALTGSLLTTACGMGVLVLAVNPLIGAFGLLTGLSVLYAYLAAIFVLPSVLVVWHRAVTWDVSLPWRDTEQSVSVTSADD
jgi:predicted RND superfamily exporter protein